MVSQFELKRLSQSYSLVTGQISKGFVCPITLKECGIDELIDGHVINEAIGKAPRLTLPQYRDVDNYYGAHIENDAVKHFNMYRWTKRDIIKHGRKFVVMTKDGKTYEAFPVPRHSNPPFHSFYAYDENDISVSKFFIKVDKSVPIDLSEFEFETTTEIYEPSVIGFLLKAAHLSLFNVFGYQWVYNDLGGIEIQRALNEFYRYQCGKDVAEKIFRPYRNCYRVVMQRKPISIENSITHKRFLVHRAEGRRNQIFAISVILPINAFTYAVMLPSCSQQWCNLGYEHCIDSRLRYERLLENPFANNVTHKIEFKNGVIRFATIPQNMVDPSAAEIESLKGVARQLDGNIFGE